MTERKLIHISALRWVLDLRPFCLGLFQLLLPVTLSVDWWIVGDVGVHASVFSFASGGRSRFQFSPLVAYFNSINICNKFE
jgi:hypothetical protein